METIIQPQEVCRNAFALMREKQYVEAEKLLANCLTKTEDPVATGLFHSALGILYKLQGEFKMAWKHYQRAERLIPDDPALKLISARLLIEEFHEYDQAIKKCRKVLALLPAHLVVVHHAQVTMGLAYARKGNKRKALELLAESMTHDFHGFATTHNIDFHLVEWCCKKEWDLPLCRRFLEKAHAFAQSVHEEPWTHTIAQMLEAFPPV